MATKTPQTTTSGRARVLPLVVAFAIVGLGSMMATQLFASALSYQPALGEPIAKIFGIPLYQPVAWLKWFFAFRTIDHPVLDAAFATAARTFAASLVVALILSIFLRYLMTRDLQKVTPDLHGTAHWMSAKDIKASGLVGSGKGVYIGGWTEKTGRKSIVHYLRHNGPEHILVFAPTRSGKGVGLVLPTLLSWEHSCIVYDIKGEAWALTSGWRQSAGQKTLRFDPADPSGTGVAYNPLEEIRLGTVREVGDVQNLVTMIVDPDGKGLNDHWAKTGHALLVGAVLHVMYAGQNKTLAGVAEFLSDPTCTFEDALNAMLETEHDPTGQMGWTDSSGHPTNVHPVVASSARDMLNKADNERSGVLSTAMSFLTLYRDPIVAMNTRQSQFKISDLMNDESPVSLYLVVRPSDQARLKPLTRLLINQIVRGLTEEMKFKEGRSVALYKHRLLLLMDEFPSLGKLEIFEEALAFMAGYGMKAYLITQDLAQLQKHYSREEAITSNCHIRVAFAPNKYETAKMLSDMVGTTTVIKTTHSYSGKRSKTTLDNISAQASEHARPLLTPDEIMRLRGPKKDSSGNITEAGDMLIFQAGFAPIMGTQILYFLDPTFNERSLVEPPPESDRVRADAAQPAPVALVQPPGGDVMATAENATSEREAEDAQEDSTEPADFECPPLTDSALIADDEEYPEAYTVPIDMDEEAPLLGRQFEASPEDLASIPDDPDEDSPEDPEPFKADSEPEEAEDVGAGPAGFPSTDALLEMSRQWSYEVPATLDLPEPEPEPDRESLANANGRATDPAGDDFPSVEGADFLAASRTWAVNQLPAEPFDLNDAAPYVAVPAADLAADPAEAYAEEAEEAEEVGSGANPDGGVDGFDFLHDMVNESSSMRP